MTELILNPWPWYVAGPTIAIVMFLLIWFGQKLGFSSNLQTMCAAAGGSSIAEYFRFDWRQNIWNLLFVLGTIIGGFIAANYLTNSESVILSENTISELKKLGFSDTDRAYLPNEIFGIEQLSSIRGLLILIGGGFMVGFGARYANGCTSGHAISGLSNLQLPSLIAVMGFFIGGLSMVYLIMPFIFG